MAKKHSLWAKKNAKKKFSARTTSDQPLWSVHRLCCALIPLTLLLHTGTSGTKSSYLSMITKLARRINCSRTRRNWRRSRWRRRRRRCRRRRRRRRTRRGSSTSKSRHPAATSGVTPPDVDIRCHVQYDIRQRHPMSRPMSRPMLTSDVTYNMTSGVTPPDVDIRCHGCQHPDVTHLELLLRMLFLTPELLLRMSDKLNFYCPLALCQLYDIRMSSEVGLDVNIRMSLG
jgi:hypothetical protein